MNSMFWQDIPYIILSFFVGTLVGMTGVGGGALMTPLLILFFGIQPCQAVGTDLVVIFITKIFGSIVHHRKNNINKKILFCLCSGSFPASVCASFYLYFNPNIAKKNGLIYLIIGIVVVLTSIGMLLTRLLKHPLQDQNSLVNDFNHKQKFFTILTGVLIGTIVTFTSIGAGVLGMLVLFLLYSSRVGMNQLVGTDIAHSLPLTFVAGIGHVLMGDVNFHLMSILLVGSIPGILLGSNLTGYFSNKKLNLLVSLMLFITGAKLILIYYK